MARDALLELRLEAAGEFVFVNGAGGVRALTDNIRDFARHSDLATTQGYVHEIESGRINAAIGEALAGTN